MNLLDLMLAVILGGSVLAGFISGFARAGMGFVAAIAGVILGFWFYDVPGAWFVGMTGSAAIANLVGFFVVFFLTMIAGTIIGRIFSKLFKWTGLGFVDRLLGAGFGFVRGSLVVAAAVAILLAAVPRPVPNWMTGSTLLPYALGASNIAASLAPKALKDAFSASVREIRKDWAEEIDKAKRRAMGQEEPAPKAKQDLKPQRDLKIVEPPKASPQKALAKKARTPKTAPPKAVNQ